MNRSLQSPPEAGSHLTDHSESLHLKNLRMRLCDIEMKIRQVIYLLSFLKQIYLIKKSTSKIQTTKFIYISNQYFFILTFFAYN